ncbi:helix-turn-helix transcriptional regulator [Agrobacterium rosae]|uniref:HTH-type quorum sensing-dependent transcriptional regulator VjbR n=1 Tax=Agrobacterium rosae TaxID=1972867 RepID=A0A1R3TKT6_9HYPH|nr:LuxR family transcriptional regulator [Agrobacterium rosae]KAA3514166.1 LuxR family transcriptional regulator [Agrobacterium rosae]KAA3522834.1 LuxR family transcriptional regulator [Agrobacterium rosae]MBN7807443.1 autoinducer binding domain-containing protein [Agrobacterium rosae]MCM2433890.1 LuxR family transcriptional regulator [Agrobacterium rosae]MDX8302981.1 LuxR family transcriptional regulator [Agrobacterium rosae]
MLTPELSPSSHPGAECAQDVEQLKTQFDIFRFLKKITEAWGMKAFMVINLPSHIALELSQYTVITNWPAELLHQYDHEGLLSRSNVLRTLKQSSVPFRVDLEFTTRGHDDVFAKKISDLFGRFGMTSALWFPVQDPSGQRGAVSFHGDNIDLAPRCVAEIAYISAHVFSRLAYVRSLDSRIPETLTDREIDCLNWTAAGKTSAEIAEILTLSEHTVNHYLNRATKKLNTVNRTQAVAKALRVGIIK